MCIRDRYQRRVRGRASRSAMDSPGLDDLLGELQGELDSKCTIGAPVVLVSNQSVRPSATDDLDDLLSSLDGPSLASNSPKQRVAPVQIEHSGGKRKCSSTHLGPEESAGAGIVCCDKLRCNRCDLKVVRFQGYAWSLGTDYLFMRYNYPDWDKLCTNLMPRKASQAYGCGCAWRSVDEVVDITPNLSEEWRTKTAGKSAWHQQDGWWLCAGH
eukprot:TRINITY_DN9903_c0_g1_i1.p1 TRINITY_DN9903_c0_g1~~TRINITY_DN9903_c0_g1_i1.p1  ORF type:complete len:213 (+),score=24.94 TRINITY_DN9903_c0_g1_i1:146-784(+)